MANYFKENFKYLRKSQNLKQKELALLLKVSNSMICDWEKGRHLPKEDNIEKILEIFKISRHDLFEVLYEEKMLKNRVIKDISNIRSQNNKPIPLLGEIAAGLPIFAEENIEDYFYVDSSVRADFCLRIKGDSMIDGGIFNKDIVFLKKTNIANNGDIVAVLIYSDSDYEPTATLKKFTMSKDQVILRSMNNEYEPQIYSKKAVKILGRLVATLHYNE